MAITNSEVINKYLAWCEKHRSPRTVEWYSGHLAGFLKHLGKARKKSARKIKPHQVVEWVDGHERWGDTYRRGAIVAVQRAWNWAEELGHIDVSPLKKIRKPPAKRRENHMTPEDFQRVLGLLKPGDPFRDLFLFVWQCGCRPQEVRHIEPRHVELERERIVFPAEESKGKRAKRVIYLQGEALEIVRRLMAGRTDEGKLFRNKRGTAWTKYAICNRFHRLSKLVGKKLCAYSVRHGFATRKLKQGHDGIVVGGLMGHVDGVMVSKVYQHVTEDAEFLKKALAD